LNTEMGIIVDCPQLADAVTHFFDKATLPTSAYAVTLIPEGSPHGGKMQWRAIDDGKPVTYDRDPAATMKRRLEVQLFKLMPIEGML